MLVAVPCAALIRLQFDRYLQKLSDRRREEVKAEEEKEASDTKDYSCNSNSEV
jgi:hypothetical protein